MCHLAAHGKDVAGDSIPAQSDRFCIWKVAFCNRECNDEYNDEG